MLVVRWRSQREPFIPPNTIFFPHPTLLLSFHQPHRKKNQFFVDPQKRVKRRGDEKLRCLSFRDCFHLITQDPLSPPSPGCPLLAINSPLTLSLHYLGAIYWCVIVFELVRCGTLEGRKKQGGGSFRSSTTPASNILRPHHYTLYYVRLLLHKCSQRNIGWYQQKGKRNMTSY